jgi:DNA-binding transcriptional ArsR family regulator
MDNKKLGVIIIALSIIIGVILVLFQIQITKINEESCACNTCQSGDQCHEDRFSYLLTGGLAVIFAILSLGIYLIFFDKTHQTILNKLDKDNIKLSQDEKFNFILLGLNEDEKKILTAIKEQDGITQQTLRIRTDMHKSRLSLVVSALEEKGLIKKEQKGKTNQLFFRVKLN